MVVVEIDDEVWDVFRRSWALIADYDCDDLVYALENAIYEESMLILGDAERDPDWYNPEGLKRAGITKKKL